jgi:uncharacterized membrane protein
MRELFSGGIVSWASFFANHGIVRTLIGFMHVGGLLASGGCAVAADRATLLARRLGLAERMAQLGALKSIHRIVIVGLALIVVSGLLLFASDFDTYLYSKLFWTKMALVALLLANGALLIRSERQAEGGNAQGWSWLILTSKASIALWFLTTLAGSGLLNIG